MGFNIWIPPANTGTMIEIPVRAPGLPANLWIHIAANETDWNGFPSEGVSEGDWKRATIMAEVTLEPGDTPVASLGCIGLAGIHRETQDIFDSSVWGLALDSFSPLGKASLTFSGDFATAGKSWPGGIWFLADILALRPSQIQPIPAPYGSYPTPSQMKFPFGQYLQLVRTIRQLTKDQMMLLRRLNGELQEVLASSDPQKTDVSEGIKVKRANLSFKMTTSRNTFGELTAAEKKNPVQKTASPEPEKKSTRAPLKKPPTSRR